jgi:hypothetical protein
LATVGLAVVLYLGYASFFVLRKGCVLCMGTYASVIGIFVVSGLSASMSFQRLPGQFAKDIQALFARPVSLLIALVFLAGTGTLLGYFPKEGTRPTAPPQTQDQAKFFEEAWWKQPREDLGIPAGGAKVVVVKFNDYQCPACAQTYQMYKPVLAKYAKSHPGAVKVVMKDWPWNQRCNFMINDERHPGACEAAAAARMARDRGKHDEMEEWLYTNQSATPQQIADMAKKMLGADFAKEYAVKLPDIKRDIADGGAVKLNGTPLLFINGVRVSGILPGELFDLALGLELNKK